MGYDTTASGEASIEIPTGNPLIIEFEKSLGIRKYFYLDEKRAKNIIFNQ